MGWSFFNNTTKTDLIIRIKNDIPQSSILIRSCCVGNHLWQLFQKKDTGERWIELSLLACHEGDWGYKSISESSHPYYYTCPLSLIKQAGKTDNEGSKEWRAKVFELHKEKMQRKQQIKAGITLKLNSDLYTLMYQVKRSWAVRKHADDKLYLMSSNVMKEATILS